MIKDYVVQVYLNYWLCSLFKYFNMLSLHPQLNQSDTLGKLSATLEKDHFAIIVENRKLGK